MPEFYKTNVEQGSTLRHHTINQLKIGMSKQQVRKLIGSPSIIDPFHNKQWNYINHSTLGSGELIHYQLILSFKEDKLSHINTDGISTLPKDADIDKQEALKK
ncbi:Outer membrane lipoprotein SmpA, a component of the essential YaeT outer-membrane protein assembly complex [uncultured Candidatus Thioglobus sp.]|nr:Outer membrane lipoprotein SmpA, a component of the essential YaeT outer-membrane protein assembly complex [uncultured Candidatus Thioglobus sp.]SMN02155.1 Outer membrane lipoprotein SmpA, a component of the essential YaeT outer-membrane protein assembly complex [uncultured Candidatus Thioglobus sp.]